MCCENGIPYGSGPEIKDVSSAVAKADYAPTDVGKDASQRGKEVILFFKNKGLPVEIGFAFAGVWGAESGIKTWNFNKEEQTKGGYWAGKYSETKKFEIEGVTYHYSQEVMQKFGYGKGVAQWSWDRPLKFRIWYNTKATEAEKTPGMPTMDKYASGITATCATSQIGFAWYECSQRTGELKRTFDSIQTAEPGSEKFRQNMIVAVDAVLRGFENGSTKSMASVQKMNEGYAKAGGYDRAMENRVSWALGLYEKLKDDPDIFGQT